MKLKTLFSLFAGVLLMGLFACQKNSDSVDQGKVRLEITDAPIDDASVEAAFITVSEIKIDGNAVEDFNKTTFNLLDYQEGDTKLLTEKTLTTGTYNKITLVLSNTDADGNGPGCYILDDNGKKHPLSLNTISLSLGKTFDIVLGETLDLVIDYDLRKIVQYTGDASDSYEFTSSFDGGIRVVNKAETGVIEGHAESAFQGSDKVIVYAYAKGTYDRDAEANSTLEPHKQFPKAITSVAVDDDGTYELHFLHEGTYEIHFVSYEEQADGSMSLQGTLQYDILGELSTDNIVVTATETTEINISVTGILFL